MLCYECSREHAAALEQLHAKTVVASEESKTPCTPAAA